MTQKLMLMIDYYFDGGNRMKKRNTIAILIALILSGLAAVILWLRQMADMVCHPIIDNRK